jgi:hypothetical protein
MSGGLMDAIASELDIQPTPSVSSTSWSVIRILL